MEWRLASAVVGKEGGSCPPIDSTVEGAPIGKTYVAPLVAPTVPVGTGFFSNEWTRGTESLLGYRGAGPTVRPEWDRKTGVPPRPPPPFITLRTGAFGGVVGVG